MPEIIIEELKRISIAQQRIVSAQVLLHPGVTLADVQPSVIAIIEHELSTISTFTARLAQGELAV
jgi:hypothetical protein